MPQGETVGEFTSLNAEERGLRGESGFSRSGKTLLFIDCGLIGNMDRRESLLTLLQL